ncbi:hypothetical protein LINGRAHAP2_LOCUS9291 [Linum grandiflorum]
MPTFEHLFEEQKVYVIRDFKVKNAPQDYHTIGYVVEYRNPQQRSANFAHKELLLKIAKNLSVLVLVWGPLMAKLNDIVATNGNNTLALIITSIYVRKYKVAGKAKEKNVFSTSSATIFYANPNIPQIAKFIRFRIKLEVYDETGGADFVVLDNLAKNLLGTTVETLYHQNGNDSSTPPHMLTKLVNTSFKVQVQVNEDNIKTGRNEFTVTKILNSPTNIEFAFQEENPDGAKITTKSLEDDLGDDIPIACLKRRKKCTITKEAKTPRDSHTIYQNNNSATTHKASPTTKAKQIMEDDLSDDIAPITILKAKGKRLKKLHDVTTPTEIPIKTVKKRTLRKRQQQISDDE